MPRKSSVRNTGRRAGVAAVAMTGVIALAVGSPTALAAPSPALQPTIDELRAAMDAAVETNRSFPNMTPLNAAMLPDATRTHMFKNLATLLNQLNEVEYMTRQPENLAGSGANSRQYYGANNPDNIYFTRNIDPNGTYILTLDPGPGTVDVNITTANLSLLYPSAGGNLNISELTPNEDGTYTIVVSPTQPDGALNWMASTGYNTLAVRNSLGDWAAPLTEVTIENVGETKPSPPIPGVTATGLSHQAIAHLLSTLAETAPVSNTIWATGYGGLIGRGPENDFLPIEGTIGEGSLAGQATSFGRYNLAPDEALVVTVPAITTAYSGVQLTNVIGQTIGYASEQTSLNNAQVIPNADGTITYVVSATDPGVPNWLDTTGLDTGNVLLRWQNYSGEIPDEPIRSSVVPVEDVLDHLPAGTATVTPQQRAHDLKRRLLSYNFALNASKDPSWVMLNLQMDDLEAAMGTEEYEAVFGEQPVAPLSARLAGELRPEWAEVAWSVLANPLGSLSAILETLPQAVNDIQLPMMLAVVRTAKVLAETGAAVSAAVSAGRLDQALTAIGAGVGGLAAVLNETLTDPNSSIAAGLLNARDDLALQVSRADDYDAPTFGSVLSSLAEAAEVTATNAATTVGMVREAVTAPADSAAGDGNVDTAALALTAAGPEPTEAGAEPEVGIEGEVGADAEPESIDLEALVAGDADSDATEVSAPVEGGGVEDGAADAAVLDAAVLDDAGLDDDFSDEEAAVEKSVTDESLNDESFDVDLADVDLADGDFADGDSAEADSGAAEAGIGVDTRVRTQAVRGGSQGSDASSRDTSSDEAASDDSDPGATRPRNHPETN